MSVRIIAKIAVLTEKPSVGKDIARVLRCHKGGNGYLEGDKYIVTWALGHLVTLADPEDYEDKYKEWRLEDLPMLPRQLKLTVIKQSAKQYYIVKEQLTRKDVSEIVIATDAGREGELVARWILEKANISKPLKRLWISSVTDKAISQGFSQLRPGREYENLFASAVARSEADWYVGLNATRALTVKFNAQLSCGRVQTPTLVIIARREQEIQNFTPRTFYGLVAQTDKVQLTWQDKKTGDSKTFEKSRAEAVLTATKQQREAVITEVEKVYKKRFAPQLYDLTELQRDGNKMYGFSAKETLSIMQKLYEQHKVLTYPRTDSRYLSSDLVDTLPDRVRACGVGPFTKIAFVIGKSPIKVNTSFVDNNKVSDHHAIIPTEQTAILTALSDKEKKIYELVVKRFLAVLQPPFEYEQVTVKAQLGDQSFVARGKTVIALGWKELYHQDNDDEKHSDVAEQNLPSLRQGDKVQVSSVAMTTGKTKAPPLFTEATLLSAMENPANYMNETDEALKKTLGETGGLGTVATRADIIEKLANSFLIEKKGKDLVITAKGKQLLELVPEELRSPALTGQWEQKLAKIAKGSLPKQGFMDEIKRYTQMIVANIKNSQEKFRHDNMTRTKCPDCDKYMLEVNGKRGKLLVCQDRECGHRQGVSRTTNARCPQCHKKLELRGEGEGQLFVCPCGHREKLSGFTERKKKETASLSKRGVANYLKDQQSQAEPPQTALAAALAKLQLK